MLSGSVALRGRHRRPQFWRPHEQVHQGPLGAITERGYPLLGSVLLVGFWVPVTEPNRSNLREERFLLVQGSLWWREDGAVFVAEGACANGYSNHCGPESREGGTRV